jgi:hypothetical protein
MKKYVLLKKKKQLIHTSDTLTYLLHGAVLPENLKLPELLKKFPAFYGT